MMQARKTSVVHAYEAVKACALCHNVTPVEPDETAPEGTVAYQASSPDEVLHLTIIPGFLDLFSL